MRSDWRPWPGDHALGDATPPWRQLVCAAGVQLDGEGPLDLRDVARVAPARLAGLARTDTPALCGVLLGVPNERLDAFARSTGTLVCALHNVARVLLTPHTGMVPNTWTLLAPTPAPSAQLQLARGGGAPTPADRNAFRGEVARAFTRSQPSWPTPLHLPIPAVERLNAGLQAALHHVAGVAAMQALVAPPPLLSDPRTWTAATAWLQSRAPTVVEHQAFGFDGAPAPRTETRWLDARVALALHRSGLDQTARLTALLDRVGTAPPRWYDGWEGIPPDADSLATWLDVAHALGRPVPSGWLTPLLALGRRPSPTWFDHGASVWGGPDCAAVRCRLTAALLRVNIPSLNNVLEANLTDLTGRAPGADSFHYPPPRALGFALEVAALWTASGRPVDQAWVHATHERATRALVGPTPPPGPMATATLAAGLARLDGRAVALSPALRYLERTQRPDGSWLAEPAFVIPGRPPSPSTFLHSRALTTAVCVEGGSVIRAGQESQRVLPR